MSPLEIVLVSVLGALVIVFALYLFILNANKRNRLGVFKVINENVLPGGICFLGDSLTDFFPIQDFFPRHHIYNRGIAGDTTDDVLKRLDNLSVLKPRKIFVQIGTNDLGKNKKPEQIVENIRKIYTNLFKENKDVELIGISLYPVSHHRLWLSPIIAGLRSNKKILKTNLLLQALCRELGVQYIDMHRHLIDKKGRLDKQYTIEGLHVSALGYGVIATILRPYLD